MRILNSCAFSKIRSCKPGCASASPAHFLCSTARIRQNIGTASVCSCKLLWRSDECVSLPCFNAQPHIFAVMNCCVVAFSSDILTWSADCSYSVQWHINYCKHKLTHKLRGVRVEDNAYYVKKHRQNFGLVTWTWCQILTSQIADTKYKWPPSTIEWNPPHENFLRMPLILAGNAARQWHCW